MPELFGIDIAQEVADGLEDAGGVQDVLLYKNAAPDTGIPCKGFQQVRQRLVDESLVSAPVPTVSIVGASLPAGTKPDPNDQVSFDEGATKTELIALFEVDPAEALFVFRAA